MYVKTKRLTLSAVCLAFSMILILAESVFRVSTLSLYTLAGILIGIVILETGLRGGAVYLFASVLISFFLAPEKLKLVTYYGVEAYIFFSEAVFYVLTCTINKNASEVRALSGRLIQAIRLVIFNVILIPVVLIFPELILTEVDLKWKLIAIVAGQPLWFVFELIYTRFLYLYRNRFRKKVL